MNTHADIDIGIIAARPIAFGDMVKLKERIEGIKTLYKIDLVDFTDRDDALSEEALQKIEVLYEKG